MKILAIETTGKHPGAALSDTEGERVLIYKEAEGELNHTELLIPLISELLNEAGIRKTELSAIAVSAGPGSFTGIRVGVATARALCQGLGIQGIRVPTLPSFIFNEPEFEGLVCPVFDAKRSEVYAGAYLRSPDAADAYYTAVPEAAYKLTDYLALLGEKLCNLASADGEEASGQEGSCRKLRFYGDGALAYRADIEAWQRESSSLLGDVEISFNEAPASGFQRADSIARLAMRMLASAEVGKASGAEASVLLPYSLLLPIYLRRSEAEIKLEQGLLGTRQKKIQSRFRRRGKKIDE